MRTRTILCVAVMLSFAITSFLHAKFAIPPEAPVDRLIKNISAYVQENPKDPRGYYTLGRVHYLAFVLGRNSLSAFEPAEGKEKSELPQVSRFQADASAAATEPATADTKAALLAHLSSAMANFDKVLELSPDDALFQLGAACLWEEGAPFAAEVPLPVGSRKARVERSEEWKEHAIAGYLKAYKLAIKEDTQLDERPVAGLESLVSYEAGQAYLRLVTARGAKDDERKWVNLVRSDIQELETKPEGPITPIVFSLSRRAGLGDLIDTRSRVAFDLDGTGRAQAWPWVNPGTVVLVWDPRHVGRITSGRQLFGSVTFWLFWPSGYSALDALDDNRDGKLSGDELIGLALWNDRNGNGVSEPGEVSPIETSGIESLSVRATSRSGDSPCNLDGLRVKDGRMLPTYDWMVRGAK